VVTSEFYMVYIERY